MKHSFILLYILVFASVINSSAQNTLPDSLLSERVITLDETVVSANKVPEAKKNVAQQIEVISEKQISQSNPATAAEMLSNTGQIMVQKSQQGGGSPVLRGFEASRVLLEVDNVRMNNLIYRAGHLQNVITLDPSMLENTEILFGPSSTVYGSDALGGVIHLHTKDPVLSDVSGEMNVHGNAFLRFASANNEKTGHLDLNLGGAKLASITSFTFTDFDDLVQGKNLNETADSIWLRPYYVDRINDIDSLVKNDNIYKQVYSGYSQYDILEKLLFKQSDHVKHVLNLQLSNSSDIPRYDRLTDPDGDGLRNAAWYYGPQLRTLASYELHLDDMTGFFNSYTGRLNYQYITESRHQRRVDRTGLQNRNEKVGVFGFGFDARKTTERNDLRVGLEGYLNSLTSTAEEEDIETGEISSLDTRYPDGDNTMNNIGLYATDTWKISDQWVLNGGLRLESITLHSTFVSKEFFDFPFDEIKQSHLPLSGSLGIIWNGNSGWRIAVLSSTGFHAPDVDDLAKVFESAPGSVIVPNPDLEPERTFNVDLNVSKVFSDKVKVELVGFATMFNNAIVTDNFTYNGEDSIVYDGELSQVLANQNKRKAFLYGMNANLFIDFTNDLSLVSTITYTKGEIVEDEGNDPLDHIPPVIGKTSIVYHKKGFRGELFANYNGWKHIEDYNGGGEDNEQYATPEGMPAWWTLNLRLQYQINKNLMVQAACENLLDANYRVFASGISAPGRNFMVTLRGSF
ncbi:MAG: TonB-dependent receptor [Chitinophagaceae bacterium]|nr:TonB-dependent receptor [Chitinophagaceae bacterium]